MKILFVPLDGEDPIEEIEVPDDFYDPKPLRSPVPAEDQAEN